MDEGGLHKGYLLGICGEGEGPFVCGIAEISERPLREPHIALVGVVVPLCTVYCTLDDTESSVWGAQCPMGWDSNICRGLQQQSKLTSGKIIAKV